MPAKKIKHPDFRISQNTQFNLFNYCFFSSKIFKNSNSVLYIWYTGLWCCSLKTPLHVLAWKKSFNTIFDIAYVSPEMWSTSASSHDFSTLSQIPHQSLFYTSEAPVFSSSKSCCDCLLLVLFYALYFYLNLFLQVYYPG